jgi:orotate phosphoribosyltransferase
MKLTESEAKGVLATLDFKRKLSGMDLIVAIARDWRSGDVLMQAYMNREATEQTLTSGRATYWSTSRRELWVKGETSGCPQKLRGLAVDCDGDAIILDVDQVGPACHLGHRSCFDSHRVLDLDDLKGELIEVIRRDALTLGEFTLTSGRKSSYYLDVKKVTAHPGHLHLIASLASMVFAGRADLVAGPELGAIPVVVAVALRSHLPYAMIRKGDRSHGTGRRIEGDVEEGCRVLLVDDVTTSGGSLVASAEAIREAGAEVAVVTSVVDRMEGARERMASEGLPFEPLLTVEDLGISPDLPGS